jgi:hypothetical protein
MCAKEMLGYTCAEITDKNFYIYMFFSGTGV